MASYTVGKILAYCYSYLGFNPEPSGSFNNEDQPCRFPLGDETSSTCELPDGRKLGYAEYGDPNGKPILYLHGLPGSRIEGALIGSKARGARIIATERPGIGWSSPQPGRKLLDFPKDLQVLIEHLGLEEYGVLGISGGGPYALACAYVLPANKLKALTIEVGLGPPDLSRKGMAWLNWCAWSGGWNWFPGLCAWLYPRMDPQAAMHLTDEERYQALKKQIFKQQQTAPECEQPLLHDAHMPRFGVAVTKQTFAHGMEPFIQDAQVMSSPFGFRIEDIRKDLPMHLWYGKHDWNVPPIHGVQLAERLGTHASLRLCDETHGSLTYNHLEEIIEELVRTMGTS